jgi:DNA-directed RNA polymerase specialized sigma24 family protein
VRRQGLSELCLRYWKPIYSCIRIGWAKTNEDAKDLTQAFLLWLLEGSALQRYSSAKASFRTYLKALLKHFLQNHEKWKSRNKRCKDFRWLSLEEHRREMEQITDRHGLDSAVAGDLEPDRAFDREWFADLLGRGVDAVRERYLFGGMPVRFQVFEEYDLCPPERRPTYDQVASRLGLKVSDVRNYLFIVRDEVRQAVRAEMAALTKDTVELEREWDGLFGS